MEHATSRKFSRKSRAGAAVVALAAGFVSAAGCASRDGQEDRGPIGDQAESAVRTAHDGPVTLTLTAAPVTLDMGRRARVSVEITAETGVTVTPDSYDRALEEHEHHFDYRVVDARRERAVPTDDGKLRWTYTYDLEFVLSGEYALPPASLSFVDERSTAAPPANPVTLETESITLVVHQPVGTALTPEEMMSVKALDPVELPHRWRWWWWASAGAAMIVIAVVIMLLVQRRKRRPEEIIVIPAHEWARSEFAALLARDLPAQGRFREFYYGVSDIVRGYIERRFNVAAPDMTTEEFLAASANDWRFGATTTDELNRFLEACDLVKYAKYQPSTIEAKSLLQTAHAFVDRTRERPRAEQPRFDSRALAEETAA